MSTATAELKFVSPQYFADVVAAKDAEIARLKAALRDHESCVVCEASLVPYDGPLHCEDCIVTDDHYYAWQDRRSAQSEGPAHE